MKKAPSMGSRGQSVRTTGFWGRLQAKEVYHDVPPDEKGPALPRGGAQVCQSDSVQRDGWF